MINDSLLSVTGGDLISYLNGSEGTATSVNQAWMDYLTREGYTTGTLNDRLYNKLRDDGFTGTLADMLTGFWSKPQTNYAARLDGVTQYWQLSGVVSTSESDNYKIKLKGTFSADGFYILATKSSEGGRVLITSSGVLFINKEPIAALSDSDFLKLTDGNFHALQIEKSATSYELSIDGNLAVSGDVTAITTILFDSIGPKWAGSTAVPYFSGAILDFEFYINDVLTNEIPLTNKAQGATQLATVGSVNATMVNYTEAVWEEV